MSSRSGRRRRRGGSLRRRRGTRTPKRTFLVFCEGKRTEPDYLNALKREPAIRDVASVDIRIDTAESGAVPKTLVERAAAARVRLPREQGEVDEVWCVFDVEWPRNHPDLHEAKARARRGDVRLAISNPCFELWLVLHFAEHTRWLDNDAAQKLRRRHDGSRGKELDGAVYIPRRADAVRRARALTAKHEGDGTDFPDDNPSSDVYRLVEAMEAPSPGG